MDPDNKQKLQRLAVKLDRVPAIGLLVQAIVNDVKQHSKDMAASIAYFGMLSIFPLILGLIALASSVLKSEALRNRVLEWVNEFFPVGADFVTQNIESLVSLRGPAGIASVVVLLWSASKMVGAISRGVNRALELRRDHALLLSPLRNFGLISSIAVLMVIAYAITPIADLLSSLDLGFLGRRTDAIIDVVGGRMVSLLTTGLMVAATYTLVPYQRPEWRDLLPGLAFTVLLIELGKLGFVYYVTEVASLDALYGSISTFIVLMLWLYFFGRALLFGARVIHISRERRSEQEPSETPES